MVASDHSQQGSESQTATAVDKEVTDEKKGMDASDPSQTGHMVASEHSQKAPESETILAESNEIILGAGENKDLEEGDGTATSVDKDNDLSLGSTDSSNNFSNQISRVRFQG
jgi:hypothetical protein